MADHININEPCEFDRDWANMVQDAKLKLELEWANKRIKKLCDDLDSIFNRVERGDIVRLYYQNGKVIEIAALNPPTDEPDPS